MKKLALMAVVAILMFAFTTKAVMAQEKAKAEKEKTAPSKETKAQAANVLFENERVRVVQPQPLKPGEKNEMKMRSDRVNVAIKAGKVRVHYSDGKKEDFDLKPGSARFLKAGTTQTENIGKTETQSVVINLK